MEDAQPLTNRSFVPWAALFLLGNAIQALCVSKLAVPGGVWPKFSLRSIGGEGQSCSLGRSQSLQVPQVWLGLRLGNWVVVGTIFFFLWLQEFRSVLILWVFQNYLPWTMCQCTFRCQDEQDQKHCFFTVEMSAVVSLLLLKINVSTRYLTSHFAIAKSSMTSYPWKQLMKANLHSPLILLEFWGKARGFFALI